MSPGEDSARPTVCLAMIVRNEAHVVTEALESVRDLIDRWCIVDTGSTDGTQDIVRAWFAEAGVSGELHERPWVDFGTNRTEALALARPMADWTLMLDADDILVGHPELDALPADAYMLRIGTGFTYWRTQLFRNTLRWEYRGALHEYPVCEEPCGPPARLEGDYHIESRRLGDRNRSADKYERDSEVLRAELARDPDDPRTVFYLAQSRLDAGDAAEAYELYTRRTTMGGWEEEVFYSHLQRARALERQGAEWDRILAVLLEAWQSRPTRAEPLVEIARHYRSTDAWDLAHLFASRASEIPFPDEDLLFVSTDAHMWQALDERAIAAFYLGRHDESFDLNTRLINGSDLPLDQRERVLANRSFSIPHRRPVPTPTDVIERLTERSATPIADPRVTLTVTTCRRRDLFERTIDSFLAMCLDVDEIERWICIDDGSSAADRAAMQSRYPFFEFVWKDAADKGHARSMEMLRTMVTTPWWVHLEDDWEFLAPDHHVTRSIAVLDDDATLGQVLFNRNYAETIEDLRIPGGELRRTTVGGHPYRVHTHHVPGSPDHDRFTSEVAHGGVSNAWWPHFSLRPSVLRTATMKAVGAFDPDAAHFELDMAQRYTDAGWRSAFFDSVGCVHTGPLTSDRGADRRPNAYALNDEPQFGIAPNEGSTTSVRLAAFWADPTELASQFGRQAADGGRWNGLRLTDADDADVTVVLNHPAGTPVDPARTIVVHMEPAAGVRTWGAWSDPPSAAFRHIRHHEHFPNVAEWHLDATWSELGGGGRPAAPIDKTRDLSIVVSDRTDDPGQRLRVGLVQHLVAEGVAIDVFGRGTIAGVTDHRGELPERDKRQGLFPYRYTIAVENHAEHNYVTEKFFDAILSECLCFYWGCPNLEQLVDPDVFVRLPIEDPSAARRIIDEAIAADLWSDRIDAIRAEKRRILDEYQLFPTIDRVVTGLRRFATLPIHTINLDRRPDRWTSFVERIGSSTDTATAARFERVAGVDGMTLERTPEIEHLFRGNDFDFRRGLIGCALTHLGLWRRIAEGAEEMALICEDDISVVPEFRDRFVDALGQLPDADDFDLAFLGTLQWPEAPDRTGLAPRHCWRPMVWEEFLGGFFGYLVTRRGARHLLSLVDRDGIQTGIDWFPMRHAAEVRALECLPALVSAPMAWPGRSGDSDIQHDLQSLPKATRPVSSTEQRDGYH